MTGRAGTRAHTYSRPLSGSPDDLNIVLRVIKRRAESSDCASVFFTRPRGLVFDAGDWLDIRFLEPELAVGRTYSFSSAPTERDLRITYRRGVSSFKRRLDRVDRGDTMLITQYGSNGFLLDRGTPAVMIAGGIGIAPFRSMIKDVIDQGEDVPIIVIHINRGDAPFHQEFVAWSRERADLEVHHLSSATRGRLTMDTLRQVVAGRRLMEATFYVAGPPAMVTTTLKVLSGIGVAVADIKTDSFDGY
jgi:ferredoxin-NADP reductase